MNTTLTSTTIEGNGQVRIDTIPAELRERDQWVLWRTVTRAGKPTKVPYQPNDEEAKSNDPQTWSRFDDAWQRFHRGGYDGIGYVFSHYDEYVGVDFDGCRDPETGEMAEWARKAVAKLDSYAEVSPSKTGVKVFCRGSCPFPTGKNRKLDEERIVEAKEPGIEIYDHLRYFAVTGWRLAGLPETLQQRDLHWLRKRFWPDHENTNTERCTQGGAGPSSTPLVKRARKYVAKMPPAISGQGGHNQTFSVACALVLGFELGEDDAMSVLQEYNQRCEPPWSEHELQHKIQDAARQPGERGYLRDAERRQGNGEAPRGRKAGSHPSGLPEIDAACQHLPTITEQAWNAVRKANDPPRLFRHSDRVTRLEVDDRGDLILREVETTRLRFEAAQAAFWFNWRKKGNDLVKAEAQPPMGVIKNMLATPNINLPRLARLVRAPVFAPDGTLQTEPGYHLGSQTFYAPDKGFQVDSVPEKPTREDGEYAEDLLCHDLLGEFPFTGDAERAHTLALLLLPFARAMIDGCTPLHLIEKPCPGTGATLMVDAIAYLATGTRLSAMTEGRDEDEWRKRITAKLRTGASHVLIDNLKRRLDSSALSSVITSTIWEDRILGVSEMVRVPVSCCWIATGNNPAVSAEIARRTVRIRLDAQQDRPWMRSGFRHSKLRIWVQDNRGLLVWAALTMIRAWVAAGRPLGSTRLGMFESWSETMGGILDVARIPGFLGNLDEFYDQSDAEGQENRGLLAAWWEEFEEQTVKVVDLWGMIGQQELPLDLGKGSEHSQKTRLGRRILKLRDRVFRIEISGERSSGGSILTPTVNVRIERPGDYQHKSLWKLHKMENQ